MSKYSQDELASMASTVIEDLESGDGVRARFLIVALRLHTGLSQEAILAKLHGLTVGMPA